MNYSGTAILALLVHIIINYDVLRNAHYRAGSPAASAYRTFIFGVMVFYLSDALWGLLYDTRIKALVFADTVLYFFAMAVSVFMWIRYVIRYLNMKSRFVSVLSAMGWIFLGLITLMQVMKPESITPESCGIWSILSRSSCSWSPPPMSIFAPEALKALCGAGTRPS